MKIDILIPTYNRVSNISENLNYLSSEIREGNLNDTYTIIISDNCSTDGTEIWMMDYIKRNPDVDIRFVRNNSNVGLEQNVVNLFKLSKGDFVLCLGDDDFLAPGYLKYCHQQIVDDSNLGCVIPGLRSVNHTGEVLGERNESFTEKKILGGYEAVFKYSHFAHQMSGLVFKRKDLLEKYLSHPEYRNPYLFIFFASYSLFQYSSLYAPIFKTSVNVSNEKDWGYNEVGLLDEVFKSYYLLEKMVSAKKVEKLMLRFVMMHSYRLTIRADKPRILLKQYFNLIKKSKKIRGFRFNLLVLLAKEYILSFRRYHL